MKLALTQRFVIGLLLAVAMAATRSHHFADLTHLPDASWAVFFLAGFYLGAGRAFAALLALTASSDFIAITWGGVSNFCVSPAYGFLLPAYGALFMAGRWYATRYRFEWRTVPPMLSAIFAGTLLCELLSSGGFYFLSDRFAEPTLVEFGERLMRYFPGSVESIAFYLGVAVAVHVTISVTVARTHGLQPH